MRAQVATLFVIPVLGCAVAGDRPPWWPKPEPIDSALMCGPRTEHTDGVFERRNGQDGIRLRFRPVSASTTGSSGPCYTWGLSSGVDGRVQFRFVINPAGHVEDLCLEEATLDDNATVKCILDVFAHDLRQGDRYDDRGLSHPVFPGDSKRSQVNRRLSVPQSRSAPNGTLPSTGYLRRGRRPRQTAAESLESRAIVAVPTRVVRRIAHIDPKARTLASPLARNSSRCRRRFGTPDHRYNSVDTCRRAKCTSTACWGTSDSEQLLLRPRSVSRAAQ